MRTSHLSGLIIFEDQKKAKIMGGVITVSLMQKFGRVFQETHNLNLGEVCIIYLLRRERLKQKSFI